MIRTEDQLEARLDELRSAHHLTSRAVEELRAVATRSLTQGAAVELVYRKNALHAFVVVVAGSYQEPVDVSTTIDEIDQWLEQIKRNCARPDWDAHGAAPVTPQAMTAARSKAVELLAAGHRPFIYPTPDGGMQVEYDLVAEGGHLLGCVDIEFGPDGVVMA